MDYVYSNVIMQDCLSPIIVVGGIYTILVTVRNIITVVGCIMVRKEVVIMKIYDIPIRLPGLNEYQAACRRHPLAGARMKKDAVDQVMTYLVPVCKLSWPAQIEIYYTEPNKKRDVDNVSGFGSKVILDALVKAGFLPDDGPAYVNRIDSRIDYGTEASISIIIKERQDETYTDLDDIDQCFKVAEEILAQNQIEEPENDVKSPPRREKSKNTSKKTSQIELPL